MGAAPSLGSALSTVKYHYFDSFFTYSVRRRACAVVDSSRPRHGILDPRELRSRAPLERGTRGAVVRAGGLLFGPRRRLSSAPFLARVYPSRSDSRTPPGGEFDWGGTSVKE